MFRSYLSSSIRHTSYKFIRYMKTIVLCEDTQPCSTLEYLQLLHKDKLRMLCMYRYQFTLQSYHDGLIQQNAWKYSNLAMPSVDSECIR